MGAQNPCARADHTFRPLSRGRRGGMSSEVQEDLLGLQNALLKTDSVEQFLHELAVLSAQTVDGAMSCGMALRQHGRPLTAAACSDSLASAADEVQYQTGDGPGLHDVR